MSAEKRQPRRRRATTGAANASRRGNDAKRSAKRPYHLSQSQFALLELREQVVVKLAQRLHETGWTQSQIARHLAVSQPRVSDLMCGKTEKFSLDTLFGWLLALGQSIRLQLDDTVYGVSGEEEGLAGDGARSAGAQDNPHKNEIDAVAYYTRVLLLDPAHGGAYLNRGNAYLSLKEFALAIGDFSRAFELEPHRPGALNNRALAYMRCGQLKAALQDCEKLIQMHPDYSHGFAQKGNVLLVLERYEEACRAFTSAIELDAHRPGYFMGRAAAFEALKQYGKAFLDYAQALKVDPTYEPAREAARELRRQI